MSVLPICLSKTQPLIINSPCRQVDVIGSQLLGCLLGEWGLQAELRALAGTFLLASPSVVAWADDLLEAVERGGGLDGLDASELTMSLQVGVGGAGCRGEGESSRALRQLPGKSGKGGG